PESPLWRSAGINFRDRTSRPDVVVKAFPLLAFSPRSSMPLHAGREFLSIPGPTVIPDAVLAAMQRPAVDIYSGPLLKLTDSLLADISKIFRTAGRSYIYIANGHGAWEGALTNVLSRGDKVLVLESGRFAIGWGEAAKMLGCDVEILPGD